MDTRAKANELADMTMKGLAKVIQAERFDICINKSKTKAGVAREIIAAFAARDMDAARSETPDTSVREQRPMNPALENQETPIGDILDVSQPDSRSGNGAECIENRGGPRPGAGRPKGMTADRARMTQVSECAHPVVLAAIELLFDAWASGVGCPDVALTKEEAKDLALPWTNVLEYWGVAQRIPVWAEIAVTCVWSTVNTFKMKLRIARQFAAKNRKPVDSVEVKPNAQAS